LRRGRETTRERALQRADHVHAPDWTAKIGKVWRDSLPELRIDPAIRPGSAPVEVAVVE